MSRCAGLFTCLGLDADKELLDDLHGLRHVLVRAGCGVELALEPVADASTESLDRADVVQAELLLVVGHGLALVVELVVHAQLVEGDRVGDREPGGEEADAFALGVRAQVVVGLEVFGSELEQYLARAARAAGLIVLAHLRAGDGVDDQDEVGPVLGVVQLG